MADMLNFNLNNIQTLVQGAQTAAAGLSAPGAGELNQREATYLTGQASKVMDLVNASKADGFVDAGEMKAINQAVKQLGSDLTRLQNNFFGGSVDGRQDNTARRMDAGTKDGSLTADESSTIAQKQAGVDALIGNARADGNVTAAEQKEINAAQRGLSRDIFAARHNDQGTDLTSRTIDGRQADLRAQLDAGVQSGRLDGAQYAQISGQLSKVDQLAAGARADGWVDPAERRAIRQAQAGVEKALGQGQASPPAAG